MCCPALPQIFESEVWRGCSSKQGFNSCAASDCLFKAYNTLTADGKFDAAKAKERLTIATNKNSAWVSTKQKILIVYYISIKLYQNTAN